MKYEVCQWFPASGRTVVTQQELPEVYARLHTAELSWADEERTPNGIRTRHCIIVHVEPDCSVVTLMLEDTFYDLTISDDDEEVRLLLGGIDGYVRRGTVAPRELGLTVLLRANDIPGLLTDYMWTTE